MGHGDGEGHKVIMIKGDGTHHGSMNKQVRVIKKHLDDGDEDCDTYTQTWTANVTDLCTNTALPVSVTYTWKEDLVKPVILQATGLGSGDLGCNPESIEAPTFSASDNCGTS